MSKKQVIAFMHKHHWNDLPLGMQSYTKFWIEYNCIKENDYEIKNGYLYIGTKDLNQPHIYLIP